MTTVLLLVAGAATTLAALVAWERITVARLERERLRALLAVAAACQHLPLSISQFVDHEQELVDLFREQLAELPETTEPP